MLHRFDAFPVDGQVSEASVIFDRTGNLYGTTAGGGGSSWKETLLYKFQGSTDGSGPIGGPVMDKAGNPYGTTSGGGGSCGCVVFKHLS